MTYQPRFEEGKQTDTESIIIFLFCANVVAQNKKLIREIPGTLEIIVYL